MQEKKSLKNIWNGSISFVIIVIILLGVGYVSHEREVNVVNSSNSEQSFVVINVNNHNTIYRIVIRRVELALLKNNQETIKSDECGNLLVDEMMLLKLKDYIVYPQKRIDSIYDKGLDYFLSTFFENNIIKDSISCLEERRIIDILFRNGIKTHIDCETGLLVLDGNKYCD